MRLVLSVHCRVFIKPEDDPTALATAFRKFFPFVLEEERLALVTEHVKGFETTIDVLRLSLKKESHTSAFLAQFISLLSEEQRQTLLKQKESRLDEDFMFYVRLDKKSWLEGRVVLTDSGECFHFTFEVAAYPKRKEAVIASLEKIFNPHAARGTHGRYACDALGRERRY